MAIRKYDISLDTKVRISNVVIRGRLGDGKGSIVANVTVFNDGQRYNFTGHTPQYEAKLSDGLNIIRDKAGFSAVKAAEGSFTYEFPAELFSAEGYAKASYFTFLDAKGAKQSTFDIAVEVVGMALDGELAETYVSEIDVDLAELTAEVTDATTAANKVIDDIAKNNVVKTADAHFYTDGKGFSRPVPNGITDWYQISTAGNYSITKTAVPTNAPPIGVYFNLIVNTRTSTTRDLTAINITTGVIYTNAMTGVDAWSGWSKVATDKEAQMQKITADDGAAKVYIKATMDVYEELLKLERGFYSIYISAGASNSPSTTVRGNVFVEDKGRWLSVLGVGSNNKIYSLHYADGVWTGWNVAASETTTQNFKITNDDGSTISITNYDLLNTTDVANFDGYSNTAINMPDGVSQAGYIKRKNRGGYIEVTYSPYNVNAVYRNSYNSATKVWSGWVQSANQAEVTALKGSDTGWITYNTVNGVLANMSFTDPTENGYKCAYRKITANGVTRLLLRVNISNITAESVIFANLPNGIVVNSQSGVARTNKANQKVVVVLRPNGELSINVPAGFSANSYSYHQFDWTF